MTKTSPSYSVEHGITFIRGVDQNDMITVQPARGYAALTFRGLEVLRVWDVDVPTEDIPELFHMMAEFHDSLCRKWGKRDL